MPASAGRHTMAANVEQARKATVEKAHHVIETLHRHEFQIRLNPVNGLKSMTAKQFVEIIQFFRHKITGKNPLPNDRQSNAEPELLAFIQKLAYPVTVAKSWFKTPTAPHAYADCVALLAWLADFMPEPNEFDDATYPMAADAALPNAEYTHHFSAGAYRAFPLWSKGDDDGFAAIVEPLIDANVADRMDGRVNGGAELDRLTRELRRANERLKVENAAELSAPLDEIDTSVVKLAEAKAQLASARDEHAQARDRHTKVFDRHGVLAKQIADKAAKVAKLQLIIQRQRYTSLDREQQLAHIKAAQQTVDMLSNDRATLRQFEASQLIALARAKQQFDERLKAFSTVLLTCQDLTSKLSAKVRNEIKVPQLQSSNIFESIRKAIAATNENAECIGRHKHGIKEQLEKMEMATAHLKAESDCLKKQLMELGKYHQEIKGEYLSGDRALVEQRGELQKMNAKVDGQQANFNCMYECLQKELVIRLERIKEQKVANAELFDRNEGIQNERMRALEQWGEQIDRLSQLMDDFMETGDFDEDEFRTVSRNVADGYEKKRE